jgi:hypothetical protein
MDCLRARQIVSEAFDAGVDATPEAAEAREHCRDCAECRAFVEGLERMAAVPAPKAPPELVESIVERGRKMAEAGVQRVGGVAAQEPGAPKPRPRDASWWIPRVGAVAAALAAAVFAIALSVEGFRMLESTPRATLTGPNAAPTIVTAPQPGTAAEVAGSGNPTVTAGGETTGTQAAETPRYVAYAGMAYAWLGGRQPDSGTIVPAGTLSSSLDATGSPISYDVWRAKTDTEVILISPDGTDYIAFRRVVRTLAGAHFGLAAATIPAYGDWPGLPSNLSTPTASDGSPTFVAAGKDDTGLEVYTQPGASPASGFAIAPGSSPNDPAAGNPNWTWWVPIRPGG